MSNKQMQRTVVPAKDCHDVDAMALLCVCTCCIHVCACCVCPTGAHKAYGWLPLPTLKGSHLFSPGWYCWLMASNLVLRFSWAHRLLGDLEAHNSVLLAVALLEVVRRWQWLFVRVETELRKLKALQSLPKDRADTAGT